MTDPVSTLRALDRPVTTAEAAELIAMPGRPVPSPRRTHALLQELGFERRLTVERIYPNANPRPVCRWHPPAPLPDMAFGPIDPKPRSKLAVIALTAAATWLLITGALALAGLL